MIEDRSYVRNRSIIKVNLCLIVTFFSMCVELLFCIIGVNSFYCDLISLLIYFGVLYSIYRKEPQIISKFLFYVIMSSWSVIAVFFLENGNVILRGKRSQHFGSLTVYMFGWLVFYFVIVLYEIITENKRKQIDSKIGSRFILNSEWKTLTYVSYVALLLVVVCFLSVCTKPYFLLGIDRFAYSQAGYISAFVGRLQIWLFALIPVVLLQRKRKKWIPIVYLLIFGLLLFWIGEKFTGLIIMIYFVLLSLNPVRVSEQMSKKMRKILKLFAVFVFGLLITVYINQVAINGYNFSGFINYFGDRIAAQGELWWLTYEQDHNSGVHLDEIGDELNVLIHQPKTAEMINYDFGIYKLMKKFMKSEWVTYALGLNVRATESTRADFFYYGKTIGIIVGQISLALLISFWVNFAIRQCNEGNWISTICSMYVLRIISNVSLMSDFQLLTTKRIILVYIIILLSSRFKFKWRRN